MATSLAAIRARLQEQDNKPKTTSSSNSDNAFYPHWNMDEGKQASLRFLPDGDDTNEFFWRERQMIKLPFNGVLGRPDMKRVEVQVPCIEMFGPEYKDMCPIHQEIRPWYKDETLKEMANKYWKKRSYFFQGFVRQNPITEENVPENPIRRFLISPQLFSIIKASLLDPEFENLPTDYELGFDFLVKKTSKGGYADYSTSNWARRETSLNSEELDSIEQYGLFKLKDFLPKIPTEAELRIIKDMFDASVENEAYDPDKWGSYYKPYGLDVQSSSNKDEEKPSQPKVTPRVVQSVDTEDEEESYSQPEVKIPSTPSKSISSDKASEILAMIKNRKTQ